MTQDPNWQIEWYWPNDTILLRFEGFLTPQVLDAALNQLMTMQEQATGDLKIYTMVDESTVEDIESHMLGQTAVHPVFFHPRSGKIYFVGCNRELRALNEQLNSRRPDSVRFFETVEEAAADIQARRAAYRARRAEEHLSPIINSTQLPQVSAGSWESRWHIRNDTLLITYRGFLSDEVLVAGLDDLTRKFDEAAGDLRIYCIADQRDVTGYSPTVTVSAALHPGFFHPRAGKLYVIPPSDEELRAITEALNSRRRDSVRFADSIEAASEDIRKRRAEYHAKHPTPTIRANS